MATPTNAETDDPSEHTATRPGAASSEKTAHSAKGRRRGRGSDSEHTRRELLDAAAATVVEGGLRSATARQIGSAAGCNQASIYYHFGGVDDLLVAALADSSERRLAVYRERLAGLTDPDEILAALDQLHDEDVASGHVRLTVEMFGGFGNNDELRDVVRAAAAPWMEFIAETINRVVADSESPLTALPADVVADLMMSVMIGVGVLSNLDGDDGRYRRFINLARMMSAAMAVGPARSAAVE